jgi:excisionase family DNA binding protein
LWGGARQPVSRARFRICAALGLGGGDPSPRGKGGDYIEKLLLSPTEAAAHLSTGRSKVYELMRLGQLRSVKIGASRRIPQAALADFIATLIKEPQ